MNKDGSVDEASVAHNTYPGAERRSVAWGHRRSLHNATGCAHRRNRHVLPSWESFIGEFRAGAVLCYRFVRYLSYSGCTRHIDAADVQRVIIRILPLIATSSRLCNCSIYYAYHERTVGFSSSLDSHSSSERPRSYRLCRQISWRGLV